MIVLVTCATDRGGPLVPEVELTEPSLFLDCDDGAPARAAAAFRSLAG